jgi:peptide/nickel transport system ATP-binding protein
MKALLSVKDLLTVFRIEKGTIRAVDGVSFEVAPGEVVGLIGESGCGKSVTGLSLLRLIPFPGTIVKGEILLKERNLRALSEEEMRRIRGSQIAMIFQDPTSALNPTKTVGWQMVNILRHNRNGDTHDSADSRGKGNERETDRALHEEAKRLLSEVGILSPNHMLKLYPHHLSAGMVQRVMIAMVLGCSPDLVIADEPTTNLDVIVEEQILMLFDKLRKKTGASFIYITHDMGIAAEVCDRVMVMYAGKICEQAAVSHLFHDPKHPYTMGLLDSNPRIEEDRKRLFQIGGEVPNPLNIPKGCPFHPRCSCVMDICRTVEPDIREVETNHFVYCHLYP